MLCYCPKCRFLLYTPRSPLSSAPLYWMPRPPTPTPRQTGNTKLPSLPFVPIVVLESSPYSLFTECCLYLLDFSKTWHSPKDISFPTQRGCTFLPVYTAVNLRRHPPASYFCATASSHLIPKNLLLPKCMASSGFNFYHSLRLWCNVPDFQAPSFLLHVPPPFWMTLIFLRKTHPIPLPQLLTAFTSIQFRSYLPYQAFSHPRTLWS